MTLRHRPGTMRRMEAQDTPTAAGPLAPAGRPEPTVGCVGCENAATRWAESPSHGRVPVCNECGQRMLDSGCYVSPEGPNDALPAAPAGRPEGDVLVRLLALHRPGETVQEHDGREDAWDVTLCAHCQPLAESARTNGGVPHVAWPCPTLWAVCDDGKDSATTHAIYASAGQQGSCCDPAHCPPDDGEPPF